MGGKKYAAAKTLLNGLAFVVLWASCGDQPLGADDDRWEEVVIFPSERTTKAVETPDGSVWCADADNPVVYRIRGGVLAAAYKSAYEEAGFYDIACNGRWICAVGYKKILSYSEPYMVMYDGGTWKEMSFPESLGETNLESVSGAGRDFWWVVGDRGVYTYDRGVWCKRLSSDPLTDYYVAVSPAGRTFAYSKTGGASPGSAIYISDNRGVSWSSEIPKINNKNFAGGELPGTALCTWGERLCAGVILHPASSVKKPETATYYGVLIRDEAPPGGGSYELAFFAPKGPYLYYIRSLAFQSATRGYLVGAETSVRYENGDWIMEDLGPWRPGFFHVTAGPSGFWATAYLPNHNSVGLYKAP